MRQRAARDPERMRERHRVWVAGLRQRDRKSTRLNSSHSQIPYPVFCLQKDLRCHVVVFLGCHPEEPVTAPVKAEHVINRLSVALKAAKPPGISPGRTETPWHCPPLQRD